MRDYNLYDNDLFMDKSFPLVVAKTNVYTRGSAFNRHWHKQLEIILIVEGKGTLECDSKVLPVNRDDVIVINSNEMHWMACSDVPFSYYYIIIDTSLLKGDCIGSCEQKYITPIFNNMILFNNCIPASSTVSACIKELIKEYEQKAIGYELYIKSLIYKSISILLRENIERILTDKELQIKIRSLNRLQKVFEYIDKNYAEEINIDDLVKISCFSFYHFYHIFKKFTGKTVSDYINCIRIDKAEQLLKNTDMLITEISTSTGFNNTNYFCRLFRKYRNMSPSEFRNFQGKNNISS